MSRAILDSGLNVAAVGRSVPRYGAGLMSRRHPALLGAAYAELRAQETVLTDPRALEQA
jgi:hypothetical protein